MPPPPRTPPPLPVGYLLLGVLLLLMGFGCAALVAQPDADMFDRALLGAVALLSLMLVEALWYVRPWVARAVDAWAAVCVGGVLLGTLGSVVLEGLGIAGLAAATVALCLVAAPCAAVRWYVRHRARKLGILPRVAAAPATPVAVPAPRP